MGEVSVEGRAGDRFWNFLVSVGEGMVVGGGLVQVTQMSSSRDGAKEKKKNCREYWNLMSLSEHFCPLFLPLFSYQMSSALVFILIFSEYLTL